MALKPIKIYGDWTEGYAMDVHTVHSEIVGEDVFGHSIFKNDRSKLGELLYHFKYKNAYENLDLIMEEIEPFLDSWDALRSVDVVISVPPSKPRAYQPAEEIADAIGKYIDRGFYNEVLLKTSSIQSKNLDGEKDALEGTISLQKFAKREYNILIVDDLYKTGRTLNECVRALREDEKVKDIFVLTITKTKNSR